MQRMSMPFAGRAGGIRLGAVALCLALGVGGCATLNMRSVLPKELAGSAEIEGMRGIRIWGDASPREVDAFVSADLSRLRSRATSLRIAGPKQEFNILAISGGADDGAFGAGLLVGWSDAGTRPRFDVITGVSAGALIAPLAFLGPRRDHDLRDIFTKYKQSDIFSVNVLVGLLGGSALADSTPLARLIERYVDHDLLREVAEERRKGRILLIGTTNLDAERPVVWDMGRIAMSNHPRRLSLFRQVLLASAAVPGVFPPVRIQVNDGYAGYDELHVDGGITQQVFFPPFHLTFDRTDRVPGVKPVRRLYVIRNGKISPEWQPVDEKTLSIAKRSIATLIKNQGVGDLYRIHTAAKRDGMDFNLAAIPGDLKLTSKEPFSQPYMAALFKLGYDLGRRGYHWLKAPPGLEIAEATRVVISSNRPLHTDEKRTVIHISSERRSIGLLNP
jgi:predicted acylesterase/phospholipase RssA